jgi:hypothetical protein
MPIAHATTAMKFWEPPMSEMNEGDELRTLGSNTAMDSAPPTAEKMPTVPAPPTKL